MLPIPFYEKMEQNVLVGVATDLSGNSGRAYIVGSSVGTGAFFRYQPL